MNKIFFALLLIAAGTGTAYILINASGPLHSNLATRMGTVAGEKIAGDVAAGAPQFDANVNCDQFTNPDMHEACLKFKRANLPSPFANINCDTLTNADQKETCVKSKAAAGTVRPPTEPNCDDLKNPVDKAVCFSRKISTTSVNGKPVINCDQFTNTEQKAACLVVNQKIRLMEGTGVGKIDPCHELPDGTRRAECARIALGIPTSTAADLRVPCLTMTSTARVECENATKEKLKALVTFQVDDLIRRAQNASTTLLRASTKASLVAALKKAELDLKNAKTLAARTIVLNRIRTTWKNVASKVKNKDLQNDNLNQAFTDIKKL